MSKLVQVIFADDIRSEFQRVMNDKGFEYMSTDTDEASNDFIWELDHDLDSSDVNYNELVAIAREEDTEITIMFV